MAWNMSLATFVIMPPTPRLDHGWILPAARYFRPRQVDGYVIGNGEAAAGGQFRGQSSASGGRPAE